MINETELLRLIDEQRARIIAEAGEGDKYRTGCREALTWVCDQIEYMSVVAGKHVTRETYTRAQIAALATAVEALAQVAATIGHHGEELDSAIMAMRQVIPKEGGA